MVYYSTLVQVPSENIHKSRNYIYLVTGREYSKEKKCNIYQRTLIGKINPADNQTMYPNESYFKLFESEKPEEDRSQPNLDHSDVQRIGAVAMTRALMEDLSLLEKLKLVFGDEDANLIADLAAYICLSGSSVMQHFPAWGYDHPLYSDTALSDSSISRFLNQSITPGQTYAFLKEWNKGRSRQETLYVNGDATNMNTDGCGIELAEMGYAKDDKTKPQVNIAIAATAKDNLPLLYDLYSGSYNDVSEFPYMIRMCSEFGYKSIGFILDRGYFSKDILHSLRDKGYKLIMMLKDNNLCVKQLISEHGKLLKRNWQAYIDEHDVCGITIPGPLFKDDNEVCYRHLYYSQALELKESRHLMATLNKYKGELDKRIAEGDLKADEAKRYARYFDLELSDGVVVSYKPNDVNIEYEQDMLGFFVIASTEDMDAAQVLTIYRDRDAVEKLFGFIKTEMDCKRFRVHSDESLGSKVFIVFIATILRSQIYTRMKKIRDKDKKHFTVPATIKELDKILAVRQGDDEPFIRNRKLTAIQKKMLKEFGVTEKDIDKLIKSI